MLLYEQGDRDDLLSTRVSLYSRFVTLLVDDEESQRATRDPLKRTWHARFGEPGAGWADQLFSQRRALLEEVASRARHQPTEGEWAYLARVGRHFDTGLVDQALASSVVRHAVPVSVDRGWLREQVELLLRRTGLVGERAGALTFVHETFREFLAAAHHVRTRPPGLRDQLRRRHPGLPRPVLEHDGRVSDGLRRSQRPVRWSESSRSWRRDLSS